MRKTIPLALAGAAGAGVLAFSVSRSVLPPTVSIDGQATSYPCVLFQGPFVPAVDSRMNLHYGQASGPVNGADICAPEGQHVIVQPRADGTVQLTLGEPIPVPSPSASPTTSPVPTPTPTTIPCPTPPPPGSCPCGEEPDPSVPSACGPISKCKSPCPTPTPVPTPSPTTIPCPPDEPPPGTCQCGVELDPSVPSVCGPTDKCISPCPTPSPTPPPTPPPTPTPSPSATPTPGPTPTPTPSATPTPSPGPCSWGKDIEGKCLPQPPELKGLSYPDDPKGLWREGWGKDTKGGSGTQKLIVNVLGPDNEANPVKGTLRWAYAAINSTHRIVECDPALTGTIPLETPLYWKKPWTTLDLSACDVEIKATHPGTNNPKLPSGNGVVFTAVYELLVYSPRGAGHFTGGGVNYVQPNNSGVFAIDGDGGPIQYPWDTEWNTTPAQLKRGVRRFIIDRATISNCEDDALNTWEATRQGTISRSFVHNCFHPSTSGAKGAPLPAYRERIWVSLLNNVYALNGERNVMLPRREAYWMHAAGNILWHWKEYTSKVCQTVDATGKCTSWKVEKNFPIGISIETDAPRENDFIYVNGNCFMGGPEGGSHRLWGCGVAGVACEKAVGCCAPNCTITSGRNFECCNPGMQNNHWALKGNFGDYGECMRNNPAAWVPPALPYNVPVDFNTVLAQVGAVRRRPAEQALLDLIAAEASVRCK